MPHDVNEILNRLSPGKYDATRAANFNVERANGFLQSSLPVERILKFDEEARTAEFVFATGEPIEHWFGHVILDTDPKNVNLDRVKNGICPFLVNHYVDKHAGVVVKDSVELGPKISGMAKLSRSQLGEEMFNDVKDEIRVGCSIGFLIHDLILERDEEGEIPVYRAKKWELLEVSLASIPADIGAHRSLDDTDDDPPPSNGKLLKAAAKRLKCKPDEVPDKLKAMQAELASMRDVLSDPNFTNGENTMKTAEEIAAAEAEAKRTAAPAVVETRSPEEIVVDEINGWGRNFDTPELATQYIRDCKTAVPPVEPTKDGFFAAVRTANPPPVTKTPVPTAEQLARVTSRQTLGDVLVGHDEYRNVIGKGKGARVNLSIESDVHKRATFSGSGTGLTGYDRQEGIVMVEQQRLTVADLLAQGQTDQPTVRYVQEVSYANAAATVAEGAAKPEATFDLIEVDAAVRKVAVTAKVTDETFEDFPQVRSYIDNRMMFMVEQEEEDQLLNGDGTAPNIAGILDFTIQTQAIGADSMQDAIYKAITKVRAVGFFEPDALVIHPTDYQNLRLVREGAGSGQYLGGGFFTGAFGTGFIENPPIWGLRTVVTTAIAAGDPLVGAFKIGAQVFYRNGLTIEATNSNEDDFKKNLIALRAEQRLGLAVYRPLAFCQVITP